MRIAAAVSTVLVTFMLSMTGAQARCSVQSFNFPFGQPGASASTTMTVSGGDSCNIKLREANNSVFKSIAITTRPPHGSVRALNALNVTYQPRAGFQVSVRALNALNVTYQPRAGFQGQDNFMFSLTGIKAGTRATARISVSVTVEGGGATTTFGTNKPRPAPARVSAKQARAIATPTGLRMQCLQQAGASFDPARKRWIFYTTERDGASRTDMFRLCLAGGDREKAKTIRVPELTR